MHQDKSRDATSSEDKNDFPVALKEGFESAIDGILNSTGYNRLDYQYRAYLEILINWNKTYLKTRPEAMLYEGKAHQNGWGKYKKNPNEAIKFYKKAVDCNYPEGMLALGLCYEQGLGRIKVDIGRALELYTQSSELGCKEAYKHVKRIKRAMFKQYFNHMVRDVQERSGAFISDSIMQTRNIFAQFYTWGRMQPNLTYVYMSFIASSLLYASYGESPGLPVNELDENDTFTTDTSLNPTLRINQPIEFILAQSLITLMINDLPSDSVDYDPSVAAVQYDPDTITLVYSPAD